MLTHHEYFTLNVKHLAHGIQNFIYGIMASGSLKTDIVTRQTLGQGEQIPFTIAVRLKEVVAVITSDSNVINGSFVGQAQGSRHNIESSPHIGPWSSIKLKVEGMSSEASLMCCCWKRIQTGHNIGPIPAILVSTKSLFSSKSHLGNSPLRRDHESSESSPEVYTPACLAIFIVPSPLPLAPQADGPL